MGRAFPLHCSVKSNMLISGTHVPPGGLTWIVPDQVYPGINTSKIQK